MALNDINQAISLENRYVDAYWHRHLIYLVSNQIDNALDDLNIILKINKNHAGAYLSRYSLNFHYFALMCRFDNKDKLYNIILEL